MHARKATGRNFRAERAATRKHGYHQLRCIERSIPVGWPSCSFLSTSLLPLWLRRLCSSSSSAHRRRNTAEQQDGTERGRRSARARAREREERERERESSGRTRVKEGRRMEIKAGCGLLMSSSAGRLGY